MFLNRTDAGKQLSEKIPPLSNPIVLAIPRGGVIIGHMIAKKLGCPLDVIISKKISPPGLSEYAIGAITHDGTLYQSKNWSEFCNDPGFDDELLQKKKETKRRLEKYRGHDKYFLKEKSIILVDDGIATGSTVFAILNWLKKQNTQKIILAIPVIPSDTYGKLESSVDQIITLKIPDDFFAVGQYYDDFSQVSDSEVLDILKQYHD